MWEGLLPVGSVVLLKGSEQKVMIIGVCQIVRGKEEDLAGMYDYSAVLHPYGYIDSDNIFLFNQEDIASICSVGYMDEELFQTYEIFEDISRKLVSGEMSIQEAIDIEWPEPEVIPLEEGKEDRT